MRPPESKSLARRPRKPAKESGLMKRLTSRAQLPAYIRRLPALPLSRLNDELGLEDSQEILALLGRDQMKAVLSASLWRSPQPGPEEVLALDQLIRWIDTWMREGEENLTRGVLDLGEVFLVSCLAKLLTAPDRTTEGY